MIFVVGILLMLALGGVGFAFAGGNDATKKRVAAVAKPLGSARGRGSNPIQDAASKRKNVAVMLKDVEKNRAAKKERPTMRRRLEQAGFPKATPRTFWIICGVAGCFAAAVAFFTHQTPLVIALAVFVVGLGLPRWVLGFLTNRRKKKFTENFATAIDVIVRSVRSGLPTNEALRIVAREIPNPVGSEFHALVESMKVGVTLDQGLKRMMESMPTPEVGFFAIVMTIQSKSGGNLSEALGNLAAVLRDRKRLQGKIKAMSSEAKASAMIIGSLPFVVGTLVSLVSPLYLQPFWTTQLGMIWAFVGFGMLSLGIFVMTKMVQFEF